jgi:5-methylcytosine-specific restriction endonuclease McrA
MYEGYSNIADADDSNVLEIYDYYHNVKNKINYLPEGYFPDIDLSLIKSAKNKEASIERAIQWKKENKQRASELNLASYHRNKEIRKVQYKAWTQANKGKVLARVRKYELAKINRTPQWLDKDDGWVIQEIYELSYKRTKMTGIKWHVDHIIPLQGKLVSGLHVPANLQVIPAIINMGKGNKFNG